ncbi:MAG: hypothetical protein ACREEE_16730 [Dongiaceae bacterium]
MQLGDGRGRGWRDRGRRKIEFRQGGPMAMGSPQPVGGQPMPAETGRQVGHAPGFIKDA